MRIWKWNVALADNSIGEAFHYYELFSSTHFSVYSLVLKWNDLLLFVQPLAAFTRILIMIMMPQSGAGGDYSLLIPSMSSRHPRTCDSIGFFEAVLRNDARFSSCPAFKWTITFWNAYHFAEFSYPSTVCSSLEELDGRPHHNPFTLHIGYKRAASSCKEPAVIQTQTLGRKNMWPNLDTSQWHTLATAVTDSLSC